MQYVLGKGYLEIQISNTEVDKPKNVLLQPELTGRITTVNLNNFITR